MLENTDKCLSEVSPGNEDISSPSNARIFDLYDPEFFPGPLQNSGVASSSICCNDEINSFPENLPSQDIKPFLYPIDLNSTTAAATSAVATSGVNNLPLIFESTKNIKDDESTPSLDFSTPTSFSIPSFPINQIDQFNFPFLELQIPSNDPIVNGLSQYNLGPINPLIGPTGFEQKCFNLVPSFPEPGVTMGPFLQSNLSTSISADNSGNFNGSNYVGDESKKQELDFQGENGEFLIPENFASIYGSMELQGFCNGSDQCINGVGCLNSNMEDSNNYKVRKCSEEQRKEKILRYLRKRNQRNFTKKIKYACRKTLADSRPRVKGRFAKTDVFGETPRENFSIHEQDTYEDVSVEIEQHLVDSADIFAGINGVDSFKFDCQIPSWID